VAAKSRTLALIDVTAFLQNFVAVTCKCTQQDDSMVDSFGKL